MEEIPRKLTEDEIQDILSVIPQIKSPADTVSEQNTKSMKVLIREQLKEIEIVPIGISDLKIEVLRQFNESIVKPGTVVGVTAAEALGKPITQMALNAFHTSGSAQNVSHGVDRISELINASSNQKNPACSIFFKDESLSFDDIIEKKRPEITEMSIRDLVIGTPDIESYEKIELEEPSWYSFYRTLIRDDFEAKEVLRLKLDPNLLFAYKISMEDICNLIEQEGTICVYSPISEGQIDIYPIESVVISKMRSMEIVSEENASLVFLTMVIVPALDKIKISGISGIRQIYPVEAPVLQIVKEEQRSDKEWFLILNPVRMRITGIGVTKLIKLLEVAGIPTLKVRPNYIAVSSVRSPLEVVKEAIRKDEEDEKEYEKQKRAEGARVIRRPPTPISIASKLIYADSKGSNLLELFSQPDIDSTRTYCNSVHEIRNLLGIEAARTFLIKEFIDVIGYEGYINPRHVVLLVDYMSSLGKIYGVTFTGISRQPIGALEKSSFEKAMQVYQEAAGFGEQKSVSGVSSSIFIGKKALIGTGYSSTFLKKENLERYEETRKEVLQMEEMVLDVNSFNDAVKQFSGEGNILELENMESEMFGEMQLKPKPAEIGQQKVKPSIISEEGISQPGPLVKGKPVRSLELEEAAAELNMAPCLVPKKSPEIRISTLETPSILSSAFEAPATTGQLGEGLLEEMEKIARTGKPSLPSVLPRVRQVPKAKVQAAAIFDLEEFMK